MYKAPKRKLFVASFVVLLLIFFLLVYSNLIKSQRRTAKEEEPSTVKYIDNFDGGKAKNMIGGGFSLDSSEGASIKMRYVKKGRVGRDGRSLALDYSVPRGGWARWKTDLNELDISAAEELVLDVMKRRGEGRFKLSLEDKEGGKAFVDSSEFIRPRARWQEMSIPAFGLRGVNLGHLSALEIRFGEPQRNISGTVYFDEIRFRGAAGLFFNSIKDNLYGFPARILADSRRERLLALDDRQLLREVARDVWRYFEEALDKRHGLPVDYISLMPEKHIGDYTSPTNIGLYFLSVVSAYDMGFIGERQAKEKILDAVSTLKELPKWEGFFYNFYSTTNLQVGRHYVSSLDNGWLAAGLIVTRSAFGGEIAGACTELLDAMDFGLFYNKAVGQISLGFDMEEGYSPYHYGFLATEPRATSLIAIGKGDIPREHWYKLYRRLPEEWKQEAHKPKGEAADAMKLEVRDGYYIVDNMKMIPSWGGSLFEFLMPTIIIDEKGFAGSSLGLNNLRAVKANMKFARLKGYAVWGISPCSTPDGSYGGYSEFGIAALGVKGYKERGIITPHVSFLSLDVLPERAIDNLRNMLKLYDIYGEYGIYDAVNVKTKQVSYRYMALDEGMILPAIDNYLNDGAVKKRFHEDPIGKAAVELLKAENFF